jgi:fatty-acyl-CoA synthase
MGSFASRADLKAIEAEAAWEDRDQPRSMYAFLSRTKDAHGKRPALSYQLLSTPGSKSETLTWADLHGRVTQAANLFRSLGVGEDDVVAYVMPNTVETAVTLLGGSVAGKVNPINPLLEAEQISAILRETKAKVVVTVRAFPKTDLAQKVAEAVKHAPSVKTVLEVDLLRYLGGVKRLIVPLIRPKNPVRHTANVKDFNAECARHPADRLTFKDGTTDRVAALFHTGGTTGMPKVAQHKVSGMIYNGWLGEQLLFRPSDIWKLVAHWKVTYMVTVPTALSALMQRPVDADITTLRGAFSGSAPLPIDLFNRFEKATGVQIVEGYGLTECTCLVSINPPDGNKKIGSVGLPFPYCEVKILASDGAGGLRDCAVDEIGEICVSNPGVFAGNTYTEAAKNRDLYAGDKYLRTGDLGRLDGDGYLYITGRAKDLIIRGGHNIDPAIIEEALIRHEAVAFVELVKGASVTQAELMDYAAQHIHERAAVPKHVEVLAELPKTAVGKVFKPDLRRRAIVRVYDAALAEAGLAAHVAEVAEDKKRGLVARIATTGAVEDAALAAVLGQFPPAWERMG